MNCGTTFTNAYIADVLKILESASKQSLTVVTYDEDEEMAQYLQQLRETLVECYTSLVHGIQASNMTQPLIQFTPSLFAFM